MTVNGGMTFFEARTLLDAPKKLKNVTATLVASVFGYPPSEPSPPPADESGSCHINSTPQHSQVQTQPLVSADLAQVAVPLGDPDTQNQESSTTPDETEHQDQNGPFRDAVELPHVSPKIYVYPHSGSDIPESFKSRFREVVNLFRLNTEQHPPLKPHLEHIDYELRMCGTSVDDAHPSIVVFCRPSELTCLRSLLNSKHLKRQYCLRKSSPRYSWKAWRKNPSTSSDTFKPLFNLYFWKAQRPRILYSCERSMHVVTIPDIAGGRYLTSTIGCILQVDSKFYGLTAAHLLHQGIKAQGLHGIKVPAHDHLHFATIIQPSDIAELILGPCISPSETDLDYHMNDDEEDDFVDDVEYLDLAEDDPETPVLTPVVDTRTLLLEDDQVRKTALLAYSGRSTSFESFNVPDNDWALVPLDTEESKLPNAFFDPKDTSRPTFFSSTQGSLPEKETHVLIVASNHRVLRGLLQPVPSFLGGITRKGQAEYWTVALSGGEALHPGDSGSIVVGADSPNVVFGHMVGSNPLGEVYVSPLEATMNQIMGLMKTTNVSLPEPLPLLNSLATYHLEKGDDYAFELLTYLDTLIQTTQQTPEWSSSESWALFSQRLELLEAVRHSLKGSKDCEKIRILRKFSSDHLEKDLSFDLMSVAKSTADSTSLLPEWIFRQEKQPYKPQAALDEPRFDVSGHGPLRTFDVFALIVNKMVGTGIYTAPASVFLMTGNKILTLALFGGGFLYSLVSMMMYLDFAKVLPFSGGELVYLDEMTSHVSQPTTGSIARASTTGSFQGPEPSGRANTGGHILSSRSFTSPTTEPNTIKAKITWSIMRFLGDGLFAYITYSIGFIFFFNSGTNSMQFARFVLLCVQDNNKDMTSSSKDINKDLMRFIGIVVLSIICLFQYFSPGFGRAMNKTLAVIKLLFLLALFVVGITAMSRDVGMNRSEDWYIWHGDDGKRSDLTFAKALLLVLFSFQGWENATFVAGEIPANRHHVLRRGFIAAVCTVGCLYLLIVAVFLHGITWVDIANESRSADYPAMLTGDSIGARRTWAIIAAISAFGSLNAIIYTVSRVKQAIGQAEILPWSRYLKKDHIRQQSHSGLEEDAFLHKSPQGGLAVHWIISVVLISATANSHSVMEAVFIPGYIQTYIQCFFLGVLSLGFFSLRSRQEALWPKGSPIWRRKRGGVAQALLVPSILLYAAVNMAILIINAMPPYLAGHGEDSDPTGYMFPALLGGLLIVSTAYYLLFFGAAPRSYEPVQNENFDMDLSSFDWPEPVKQDGIINAQSRWNLMRWANVQCEIRKDYTYDRELERVFRFGRRWRAIYSVPGDPSYEATSSR
ncbi:hypothetical protein CDV31_013883 [Fusarium ambrosium]|uniref:Uncharacterized protein n=1 Tax=Fusarium ambrosium TaxID=131363 RepID=A0A428T0M1_9HYPO|nr:hypothetical protein CDV31_013883 [Fusarium ambrosium]